MQISATTAPPYVFREHAYPISNIPPSIESTNPAELGQDAPLDSTDILDFYNTWEELNFRPDVIETYFSIPEFDCDSLRSQQIYPDMPWSTFDDELSNTSQYTPRHYNGLHAPEAEPLNITADAQTLKGSKYHLTIYDDGIGPLHESAGLPESSTLSKTKPKPSKSHKSPPRSPTKKHSPTSPPPTSSHRSRAAKHAHNLIEKKYRNALNDKFDALRARLLRADQTDGSGANCSKGDVLLAARRYIKELEEDGEDLKREKRRLQCDIEMLEGLWMGMEKLS